ncbi:Formamidase [Mycena sp. CBHHK59/15]|nr:Formamidase [Mycena sp. CBHHK59/15]
MSIHAVKKAQSHLAWDNSIEPVLRIQSGETVTFDCLDASNGQLTPDSTAADISSLVFSQLDQVNGPVFIEGASIGDTLQIDVLSVTPATWGWTACIPGFGLLTDEFPEPALKIWNLNTEGGFAYFDEEKRIKIPLRPFAGEMGVAPGKNGAFSTIPPYATGGNIDTKHLSVGATLFLPIEAEGALFSIGDGHAAQGDGEVCGTAIETPMTVSVRLTVRKDRPYTKTPHFTTPKISESEDYYCTTGIDSDIREATCAAVRHMIEFLCVEHQLDRVAAYMLCSVAGDLRLHEVVDMPNYVVGMMMPRSILAPSAKVE